MLNFFNNLVSPPAIALGQHTFLVAWPQRLDAGQGPGASFELVGTLVAFDGTPQGVPFSLVSGAGNAFQPALTYDGSGYLVLWADQRSGTAQIHGLRLDEDGGVLTSDFVVSPGPWSMSPALGAFGQGGSMAAYQRFDGTNLRTELRFLTVTPDGGVSPSRLGVGCGCQSAPPAWLGVIPLAALVCFSSKPRREITARARASRRRSRS
jgi:hypothetical protein